MFRILVASFLCASAMHAQVANAVGVVVDSVRGRPLIGAIIVVSGTEVHGLSDSSGRFRIDSIPPGDHTMGVLHPFLDELGIALTTNKITFPPGGTMAVVLATPSADHWIGRRCTDAERQEGPNAVMGRVLQLASDDPVPGALLHYTGAVFMASKETGLRHTNFTRDAALSPTGDFIICGIPPGALGAIRATKGRASTGDVPVEMSNGPLAIVTLRLAPDDTAATHVGVVTGRVTDSKGAPVPGARIVVRGTQQNAQSTDSGAFRITDLPLGSQVLDILKLGFAKQSTVVNVIGPDQPTIVAIALLPPPPRSAEAQLVSNGFVRRSLAGKGGVFVTADTIAKLKANTLADLHSFFPETIMRPSSDGPVLEPTFSSAARCIFYLLDGAPYRYGPRMLNRDVHGSDIVGIEYYEYGQVPQELSNLFFTRGFPHCALFAIWTVSSVGAPPT